MSKPDFFLITCEHGGNRIPSRYQALFRGHEALLPTHRGYDAGALELARELSRRVPAPLVAATVSRLLIDLNRSPGHPQLYSEATRHASPELRDEICRRYYEPYRAKVETQVARAIADGARVVHISCHSFTPELHGEVREADVGLLYDPAHAGEAAFCEQWRTVLERQAPHLETRMNSPYSGTDDGFTTYLRQRYPARSYLGIEIEINQKHVADTTDAWDAMRADVIDSLMAATPRKKRLARDWMISARQFPAMRWD